MAKKATPAAFKANKFVKGGQRQKSLGAKGGRKSTPPSAAKKAASARKR